MPATVVTDAARAARGMGLAAHAAGILRAPALDPALVELLRGRPVGTLGAGLMRAWLAGWDAANLAT